MSHGPDVYYLTLAAMRLKHAAQHNQCKYFVTILFHQREGNSKNHPVALKKLKRHSALRTDPFISGAAEVESAKYFKVLPIPPIIHSHYSSKKTTTTTIFSSQELHSIKSLYKNSNTEPGSTSYSAL